ncbi:sodium/hydrogen exchanger [Arcobacter nitrofigilis DSM 7299]|uniref:Sodium/hydrogen exchanger n=1 Tax=Arcobacter nitrofigilis (strain ATCC 33309 / DSM 7299 / CCUG 15893 / LMG 7604 / NCTC 12251 / CI) TaxID=572480 RepID=D5V1P9_ARCNC|nr:cation:proton antiporter [Arcobacter nitrofigilis]ADG93483.1 sodium/hydrogen exchanger [Arcobacter nitrofigilis DSM 7299]
MSNGHLLGSLLYLFTIVAILVTLSKRLGLGSILGLLIAGIIVGPFSYGPILTKEVSSVRNIAEFGVVLLLFVIGLEMQPKKLWSMRKEVFGLGSAQIVFSGFFIFLYTVFYAKSWQIALLIAPTFALSSTAFVMQILQDKGITHTPEGQTSFSILLMQDLAVVPLLALVPIVAVNQVTSAESIWIEVLIAIASIAALILLGKYVVPKLLDYLAKHQNKDAFFFFVIAAVVFAAWLMEHSGLSMSLGAFIMGMILSNSKYHYQIRAYVEPYKGLLMAMFFVAVGMSIDLKAMVDNPLVLLQHLVVIMAIKIVALFVFMIFMGYKRSTAISVSFLLAQSGEFGFVVFGAMKAVGGISDEIFVASITIISFSMLLTPILVNLSEKLALKFDTSPIKIKSAYVPKTEWEGVIIAGYGEVGRLTATMLDYANIPFVAFDIDAKRVEIGEKEGRAVYYGELSDLDFITRIGLEKAKAVILTIENHHTAAKIISHIRNEYPYLRILSRTKNMKTRDLLVKHGVSWAMPVSSEGALRLGAETLLGLGRTREDVIDILTYFRKNDYETIKELHEKDEKK